MHLSVQHLWLIPALPLAAAAVGALTPKSGRMLAAGAALTAMAGAFVFSCLALAGALADPATHQVFNFAWFDLGHSPLRLGLLLDPLTAFMCVMVTFVSLLIFIFSTGSMKADANAKQFFCFLSLFASAMLGLLVANSLLLLFVCWELVGLASYLLIGFWFHKPAAAAAAKKAFITTRVGDLGFLLGLLWLQDAQGTLLFYDGGAGLLESAALTSLTQLLPCGLAASTAIGLLIFCGAIGKSGQFPLHVWLPDAMEGPTPVSALIHAATMVTAGVYMVARSTPLFAQAPTAQMVVCGVGAITALLAALTALTQYDLKRVLAYSTVSQLGYMFMALGAASLVYTKKDGTHVDLSTFAVTAAMFHLFTHAFFKALLFLGAGSVMHSMGDVIDMRRFSGLRHVMPHTRITFLIGSLTLAGCPLLSGFWSKDDILVALFEGTKAGGHETFFTVIFGVAVVTAFLTAFYSFRAYNMTFLGEERFPEEAHHPHESPPTMTLPLFVLAGFSVAIGAFLGPTGVYARQLAQSTSLGGHGDHPHSYTLMGLGAVIFLAGYGLARWMYVISPAVPAKLERVLRPLHRLSLGKFFLDELFNYLLVIPVKVLALLCTLFDKYVLDGLLDFAGSIPSTVGRIVRPIQNGLVSHYAWIMLLGVVLFLIQMLRAWAS